MNSSEAVTRLEKSFERLTPSFYDSSWRNEVLDLDEAGSVWKEAEDLLDSIGFCKNLVPEEYGGNWGQMETLMDTYRVLYRRDPSLGLGYAGTSLIACCNIWAVGSEAQKKKVSELLLNNRKISCSYYEPEHGNDLSSTEFSAEFKGSTICLSGTKRSTSNIERSDAAVIFTRTADYEGSRSHSQVLLIKNEVTSGRITDLPRHRTAGMKGLQLGGFVADRIEIPKSSILGKTGQALETTMRSFQVTRTLLPGMFQGTLDSALRLAIEFSKTRRIHERRLIDFENTKFVLSNAFLDSLLIDSICRIGARALQVMPYSTCLYAPAIKVIVPHLLIGAMRNLSNLLGATFYKRSGRFGLFQKLFRDAKPVGFAHVGRPACQLTLLPLLHLSSKKTPNINDIPSTLTNLEAELPKVDFAKLSLSPNRGDPLLALIDTHASELENDIYTAIKNEKDELFSILSKIHPSEISADSRRFHYDLSSRYSSILSISSCIAWIKSDSLKIDKSLMPLIIKRQLIMTNLLPRNSWTMQDTERAFNSMMDCNNQGLTFDLIRQSISI